MNNRLNLQNLAILLAEQTGKSKEEIELFLRHFIQVVSEGVYTNKLVKVKGLGTFKIITVEKRESVHVNTGERFLIPEHYKFSFLPDKDLREQVNRPFSIFETVELGELVDFDDLEKSLDEKELEEDESTEEVLPDQEIILPLPEVGTDTPLEKRTDSAVEHTNLPQADPETEKHPDVPEEKEPQETDIVKEKMQLTLEEEPADPEGTTATSTIQPQKKQLRTIYYLFITLLATGAISYLLYRMVARQYLPAQSAEKEPIEAVLDTQRIVLGAEEKESESATSQTHEADKPKEEQIEQDRPQKQMAQIEIKRGDRLTVIALEHYGNKLFWVYIYLHNKALIDDPNNVPIGTVLEIPAPEMYGIDAKSRASREKAASLQTEILTEKQNSRQNLVK